MAYLKKIRKIIRSQKLEKKVRKYAKNGFFFCFNPYKNAKNHKKNIVDIISDVESLSENDPGDKKN